MFWTKRHMLNGGIAHGTMVVVLMLASSGLANAGGGSWTTMPSLPTARGGLTATPGPDGTIYAIGGFDASHQPLTIVERYDPSQGTWQQMADMPTARHSHGAVLWIDGRIYVIGGADASGQPVDVVECYDPQSDSWITLGSMPIPRRGLAVETGADGLIYVMGGFDRSGHTTAIAERYDPSSGTWERIASLQTARGYLMSVVDDFGFVHVACGIDDSGFVLNIHEVYDGNVWQADAPPIEAVYWARWERHDDGKDYFVTGCTGTKYKPSTECFEPRSSQWREVAPIPTPRAGLGTARGGDGLIYAIGGFDADGVLDVVEAYTPLG